MKYILTGLQNPHERSMLCKVAVGLLGDIARKCGNVIMPHCDDIVNLLLKGLMEERLLVSVKPDIISCLADIALAIGPAFERYFPFVMGLLFQAGMVSTENQDEEVVETIHRLRDSVIETCSSILRCLQEGNKQFIFVQYFENCMELIKTILTDTSHPFSLVQACLNLVLDVVQVLGGNQEIKHKISSHPVVQALTRRCQGSRECMA